VTKQRLYIALTTFTAFAAGTVLLITEEKLRLGVLVVLAGCAVKSWIAWLNHKREED